MLPMPAEAGGGGCLCVAAVFRLLCVPLAISRSKVWLLITSPSLTGPVHLAHLQGYAGPQDEGERPVAAVYPPPPTERGR